MQNTMNGYMNGYGPWMIVGVVLAVFLIVAILKVVQRKEK